MNIAKLNEKITIQKCSAKTDRMGNHKNVWEDYFTCHATIGNEAKGSGSEVAIAGSIVDHSDMDVTIRFSEKTAAIVSTGFRVVFRGELYDILAVDHMNFRKRSMKLRCKKAAR